MMDSSASNAVSCLNKCYENKTCRTARVPPKFIKTIRSFVQKHLQNNKGKLSIGAEQLSNTERWRKTY